LELSFNIQETKIKNHFILNKKIFYKKHNIANTRQYRKAFEEIYLQRLFWVIKIADKISTPESYKTIQVQIF